MKIKNDKMETCETETLRHDKGHQYSDNAEREYRKKTTEIKDHLGRCLET